MKKIFVDLPREILVNDLTEFWNQLESKLKQSYPNCWIQSNYTGEGTLEDSDVVIFVYEFKDYESSQVDMQKCQELEKAYNFFSGYYSPDRFGS